VSRRLPRARGSRSAGGCDRGLRHRNRGPLNGGASRRKRKPRPPDRAGACLAYPQSFRGEWPAGVAKGLSVVCGVSPHPVAWRLGDGIISSRVAAHAGERKALETRTIRQVPPVTKALGSLPTGTTTIGAPTIGLVPVGHLPAVRLLLRDLSPISVANGSPVILEGHIVTMQALTGAGRHPGGTRRGNATEPETPARGSSPTGGHLLLRRLPQSVLPLG